MPPITSKNELSDAFNVQADIIRMTNLGTDERHRHQAAVRLHAHFRNAKLDQEDIRDVVQAFIKVGEANQEWQIQSEALRALPSYYGHSNADDLIRANILQALLGPKGISVQGATKHDFISSMDPKLREEAAIGIDSILRKHGQRMPLDQLKSICETLSKPDIGINDRTNPRIKTYSQAASTRAQKLIATHSPG